MRRVLSWLLAWVIVGTSLTLARHARADDEPVIVVDVTEAASELDADRLRAAIARELHAQTVKPTDPRARLARGTLTVDVDRPGGELSVSYLARMTPTTRRVPLPVDGASARNAAVMLAGNLARDEASELAAELRKQPSGVQPKVPAKVPDRESDELTQRAVAAARLQATLDYHAKREGHARTFAWTVVFVGGGAAGALSPLSPGFDTPLAGVVSGMASVAPLGVVFGAGAMTLFAGNGFEKLAADHRKGAEAALTEDNWKSFAQAERSLRRASGIMELGFSALALGAGTVALVEPSMFTSESKSHQFAGVMFGFAVGEGLIGIYLLTTEGSVEGALHAYEQSTGRVVPPKQTWLKHFDVGFAPGGATATFSMTF